MVPRKTWIADDRSARDDVTFVETMPEHRRKRRLS